MRRLLLTLSILCLVFLLTRSPFYLVIGAGLVNADVLFSVFVGDEPPGERAAVTVCVLVGIVVLLGLGVIFQTRMDALFIY